MVFSRRCLLLHRLVVSRQKPRQALSDCVEHLRALLLWTVHEAQCARQLQLWLTSTHWLPLRYDSAQLNA